MPRFEDRRSPVRSRTTDGPTLRIACGAIVVGLAAGCASGVDRSADDRADRAGLVMTRLRDGDAEDMALRVVGGDPAAGTAIEALVAEGDRFDGRIVLRITERADNGDWSFEEEETVRCYEYRFENSIDDHRPRHVTCPDVDALELTPSPPPPSLPAGIDDALRAALEALGPDQRTESAVRDAVRAIAGSMPVLEVTSQDSVIGVAIGNGIDECLSAKLDGASIDIWRVPRVVAQPGELGCSATAAAQGLGTESPH